eukprot:Lithocolla_globosa_v1_NODE_260_length_4772_cov_3.217087.p6 type:complete len:133 gc:universal NODE_260_length_4772_cov_3.217087:1074-676(-)
MTFCIFPRPITGRLLERSVHLTKIFFFLQERKESLSLYNQASTALYRTLSHSPQPVCSRQNISPSFVIFHENHLRILSGMDLTLNPVGPISGVRRCVLVMFAKVSWTWLSERTAPPLRSVSLPTPKWASTSL